jgi:hypothetical protein
MPKAWAPAGGQSAREYHSTGPLGARGSRAIHCAWPAARDLMQRAKHQPALRQAGIDFLDKRQGGVRRAGALLQMGDPGAQNRPKELFAARAAWFSRLSLAAK